MYCQEVGTLQLSARHVVSLILRQLGYFLTVQAPPSNSRGGLLLAWKSDVNMSAFYVSNNIICAWYYSVTPDVQCLLSFVYGPPYKKTSSEFWNVLSSFGFLYLLHGYALGILIL
jgi:hypothetical protein